MILLAHIRPAVLRGFAIALGAGFVLLAVGIRLLHDWKAGETALVLLVPFGMGALLLLSGMFLRNDALRFAIVLVLVIAGPGIAVASWAVCALGFLTSSFCA